MSITTMKKLILLLLISIAFGVNAQTWQSIHRVESFQQSAINQFIINPYSNDIWLVGIDQMAVIENDGDINVFPRTASPPFLMGSYLFMAFTPDHTYYAHDDYGLFTFDNYNPQLILSFTDYAGIIRTNNDTVFVLRVGSSETLYKYTQASTTTFGWPLIDIASKNSFFYGNLSSPIYFINQSTSSYEYLYNDPEYLYAAHNEMKFTRNTDTLYVAGKLGISKVYNYDVFDTITPNNTIAMPSPNVLEMEWDTEDNLWAVFGDASDKPFAIAKLENDTWTNYFDGNNSPINFNTFYGLEIDTLGNVWVTDQNWLHTLLTPNSPAWLNVDELNIDNSFEVYPNPSNGSFTIATKEIQNISTIEIVDLMGRTVHKQVFQPKIAVNLPSGNYFLQLLEGESLLGVQKIVIE